MRDMQAQLEKLRVEQANCEMIAGLATNEAKRELFTKLADHYKILAAQVERAIKQQKTS
jgi:hypothetical protein